MPWACVGSLRPLGRGHGDGYNTSDSFSDEEDDEEGQRRGLGRGRDPSRGDATGTVAGSSNGAPPGVGGGGGGGGGSRRKSAMAKASDDELGLESDRHPDLSSPANSITSINSISSLLKEKLAMSLPAMLKRHRKPKEYKLRGFVAMLFLCIVFLVGFAHVYYNQQVLQKAYFDRIRLNHLERVVRVYNAEGAELLRGELGRFLRATDKVYQCLHEDERKGAYCMEWMGRARLYLRYEEEGNFRCYHINWKALAHDVFPTDCFDLTSAGGSVSHWYGGGHAAGMRWPLEAGRVSWAPFLTGDSGRRDHQWGNVLKRFFISSKGVAITVNPRTPLHVAANQYNDGELCLQAKYDDFAFVRPTPSSAAWLNYTLCTVSTGNMRELHQHLSEKSLWDGLTEADVEIVNTLLTQPVWQIAPAEADLLTEQAILNYTEDVLSLGFLQHGHILVNEFWQANVGDMAMDESRFPTMEETIKIVHRRGFRIAFTLQPFIGTESINFREAVRRKLLVGTRGGGPGREYTPALSRYRSLLSAGALDVTNKRSVPWFKEMLEDLLQRYKMDCFFLDLGVAYDLPYHYKFQGPLTNPDHFMTAFTELVQSSVTVLGVSSAIARPRVPTFVTLPAVPSTWKGLQSVIPTILTYGIIGYPFIMPGAVGGDYDEEPSSDIGSTAGPLASVLTGRNATTTTTPPAAAFADMAGPADDADVLEEAMEGDGTSGESLGTGNGLGAGLGAGLGQGPGVGAGAALGLGVGPSSGEEELQEVVRLADTELYVRWMQLASFLPVVRYTTLPNKYGSELILESARTLTSLRQKIVNPLLKKYAREALDSGLPLVRPLWMLDPLDPACRLLSDEFSIGEELIVAPVLQPGSTERDVYLPTGVWKDGIDGSLRKGSRWIHMYKVPLDKIAYFVKMPDNTRF